MSSRRQEALDYHSQGRPGKIQVSPTKPFKNQRDLSLAYTPGVAEPCMEIAQRPEEAYAYTAKGKMYYPDAIRPALEVIGAEQGRRHVSGIYMLVFQQQTFFFADCTVNIDPDAETLAEIASATAQFVWHLGIEPRVAMLSFSNFGSVKHPAAEKVQRAVALLHEREPALQVDGEMQADAAVVERILTKTYPFAKLRSAANVLIFPSLDAANIAYKLLDRLGGAQAIGPILVGMARPVHVLQRGSEVNDILNMAVIAAVDAQEHRRKPRSPA